MAARQTRRVARARVGEVQAKLTRQLMRSYLYLEKRIEKRDTRREGMRWSVRTSSGIAVINTDNMDNTSNNIIITTATFIRATIAS